MQTSQAQQDNVKKVIDIDTHEPIIGAIIYDNTTNKPITITNSDGRFSIPKNNYNQLRITCIGYKTIVAPSTSERNKPYRRGRSYGTRVEKRSKFIDYSAPCYGTFATIEFH